jgi:hypothetical protein
MRMMCGVWLVLASCGGGGEPCYSVSESYWDVFQGDVPVATERPSNGATMTCSQLGTITGQGENVRIEVSVPVDADEGEVIALGDGVVLVSQNGTTWENIAGTMTVQANENSDNVAISVLIRATGQSAGTDVRLESLLSCIERPCGLFESEGSTTEPSTSDDDDDD